MKSLSVVSVILLCAACGGGNSSASSFNEQNNGGDSSTTGDETSTTTDSSVTPDKDAKEPPGKDSGTPTDDAPVVTTDTGAPPPMLTLDNVCARLADVTCTSAYASCCSTKGLTYKESGCRAAVLAGCDAEVKNISAGGGTFNPGAFGACAMGWNALATKCTVPLLEYLKTYAPCQQLLNGKTAPGASCTEDYQCKAGETAYANCASDNKCESTMIAGKDAPCMYGGYARAICDYGLACNFSGSTSGTCRAAKAIGASCNNSLECGFGNWCDKGLLGGGKCAAGGAAGAFCSSNDSCASGFCNSGKCSDPNASPAIAVLCSGTTG